MIAYRDLLLDQWLETHIETTTRRTKKQKRVWGKRYAIISKTLKVINSHLREAGALTI